MSKEKAAGAMFKVIAEPEITRAHRGGKYNDLVTQVVAGTETGQWVEINSVGGVILEGNAAVEKAYVGLKQHIWNRAHKGEEIPLRVVKVRSGDGTLRLCIERL